MSYPVNNLDCVNQFLDWSCKYNFWTAIGSFWDGADAIILTAFSNIV